MLGIVCVYGISRKKCKPPRKRLRMPDEAAAGFGAAFDPPASEWLHSASTASGNFGGDGGSLLHAGPALGGVNFPGPGPFESYADGFGMGHDFFEPSLPDLASPEFGDDLSSQIDAEQFIGLDSPASDFCHLPTKLAPFPGSCHPPSREVPQFLDTGFQSSTGCPLHDCSREAHEILGSLSSHHLHPACSASQSTTADTGAASLDHVVRLNREANARLGRLLTCSCARSPHSTLLYTSIIARALVWY